MNDLIAMLKARCADARSRMESAQKELRKYSEVLELELQKQGISKASGNGHSQKYPVPLRNVGEAPIPPAAARMKYDAFRNALLAAEEPLDPGALVRLLGGRLSRSYTYYLIKELKKAGELTEDKKGRITLRKDDGLQDKVLQ